MPRVLGLLTGLALLLPSGPALGGARKSAPATPCPPAPPPVVERGSTEPTPDQLPPGPADTLPMPLPPQYRLLREVDVQCLAVRYAQGAILLDQERAAIADEHPPPKGPVDQLIHCHAREYWLRQIILYYTALEDRNRNAGTALELFFKLAEAEAQADLVARGRADLRDATRRSEELNQRGFKLPVELPSLHRQGLDSDAERARLDAALSELNGRLKGMIGLGDLPPCDWVWPGIECPVVYDPVDEDAAIGTALARRPELILLRTLDRELDKKTLPVIRDYLKGLNALLGGASLNPGTGVALVTAVRNAIISKRLEQALREGQLTQMIAERERAVADEVRRAVAQLHSKARLVALGRDRVLTAEGRLKDAQARVAQGGGSFLEVLSTSLEWYKTRATLTTDVMGWHAARVALKQAQGLLVWECYDRPPPAQRRGDAK